MNFVRETTHVFKIIHKYEFVCVSIRLGFGIVLKGHAVTQVVRFWLPPIILRFNLKVVRVRMD
jgi:hypothetical protein